MQGAEDMEEKGSRMIYDLAFAWNWEHDADFVALLQQACQEHGVSLYLVTLANVEATIEALHQGAVGLHAFFDRASDTDLAFLPLVEWAAAHVPYRFNDFQAARHAWDKAAMHREFLSAGLHLPYTLLLPPFTEQPALPIPDLSPLGQPFVVKPAHGGGGEGVQAQVYTWSEVLTARWRFPEDRYLVQAHITPAQLAERPAWFRVIYAAGKIFPCWWDPHMHLYSAVSPEEEREFGLTPLREIATTVAHICQLELFSTEIACLPEGRWVVVDYVNDPIDTRLQSKTADGVPDFIIAAIARQVARWVVERRRGPLTF